MEASSFAFLAPERRIRISISCYPIEVIYRTCYAWTDRAYLWLEPEHDGVAVCVTRKSDAEDLDALCGEFANALVDFALRHQVTRDTAPIREALFAAAFRDYKA